MSRNHLAGHLAVRYFALVAAALVVLAWLAAQAFDAALSRSTWADIEAAANLVGSEATPALEGENQTTAAEIAERIGQNTHSRITLVLPDGRVLFDTRDDAQRMENHLSRPEIAAAFAGNPGHEARYSDTRKEQMLYWAVPVRSAGRIVGVARAAKTAAEIQQTIRELQWSLLSGVFLVGAGAGLVGLWLARRTGRQLNPLVEGADLLSRGQPIPKLPFANLEEFSALAAALNKIAWQLDERSLHIGRQGNQQAAVLASMVEGVMAVDSAGRLITLNSAAAQLVGGSHAELQGRNLHEVIRNADLRRVVQRALESPEPIEDDVVLLGDRQRILRVRGTALRDGSGPEVGAVIVINDVTRYRHLENLRRDFVANVSHELKTPIASIKGFVETLLDGALQEPKDADRFLKIIASHAERLNNIIEDLLSLSKIEQSEEAANLPLVEAPLRPVLEAAWHGCQPQAAARQIALTLDCDDSLVANINPPLLEQAIINLIDNAIKYSEPGGTVTMAVDATGDMITIAIRDHGCGIAEEHLPRLFERFYRVDRARSRKLGGTGLGLAIVKHIVQAHQGRIDVTSTLGQGSVFSIRLPSGPVEIDRRKVEGGRRKEDVASATA